MVSVVWRSIPTVLTVETRLEVALGYRGLSVIEVDLGVDPEHMMPLQF